MPSLVAAIWFTLWMRLCIHLWTMSISTFLWVFTDSLRTSACICGIATGMVLARLALAWYRLAWDFELAEAIFDPVQWDQVLV